MRKLIITEKANAARRISTILSDGNSHSATSGGVTVISFEAGGDEYKVVSLRGHIIELDYSKQYNDWSAVSPVDLVYAEILPTKSEALHREAALKRLHRAEKLELIQNYGTDEKNRI